MSSACDVSTDTGAGAERKHMSAPTQCRRDQVRRGVRAWRVSGQGTDGWSAGQGSGQGRQSVQEAGGYLYAVVGDMLAAGEKHCLNVGCVLEVYQQPLRVRE